MLLNKILNPLDKCNLKFGETGVDQVTTGLFEGYAATFGNIDVFGDTILPGAFTETIENRDRSVKMFYEHDRKMVIGKWLDMKEDDVGLYVWGELTPGNSNAQNAYASMKHGAIDGLSIGFNPAPGGKKDIAGGGRVLSKINLVEISPTALEADLSARVSLIKSEEIKEIESIRDLELVLRDVGFSRSMAKSFISQSKSVFQRDADEEDRQKEESKSAKEWLDNLTN